ncbi:MAG TPA: peptide deformylase [Planctomycetota bacterium]|nr:peptide deformylase [Planctomycetota bacterium]
MTEKLQFQLTHYPEPVLRRSARPVERFDAELEETVAAMFDLMYRSQGVGLAAPQVGLDRRLLVLDPSGSPDDAESAPLVLVNPTVLELAGETTVYEEGCLSFPGIFAEVRRPDRCRVRAFTLRGEAFEAEYEGFTSRVVQHEYDHLEGVLLVDRMSSADKQRHKAALAELVEAYQERRGARR